MIKKTTFVTYTAVGIACGVYFKRTTVNKTRSEEVATFCLGFVIGPPIAAVVATIRGTDIVGSAVKRVLDADLGTPLWGQVIGGGS